MELKRRPQRAKKSERIFGLQRREPSYNASRTKRVRCFAGQQTKAE
jgi:hypothetical protein